MFRMSGRQSSWRMSVAVSTSHRELLWETSKIVANRYFLSSESTLPTTAVAFGRAHGGGGGPTLSLPSFA